MPRKPPPEATRLSQTAVVLVHFRDGSFRHRWICWHCKPQGKGRAATGRYHVDREEARRLLREHLLREHHDVPLPTANPFDPWGGHDLRRKRPARPRDPAQLALE